MAPEELPRAWGDPACRARIRSRPADFQVDEVLGFEPAGAGGHIFLEVRKTGLDSHEVARRLARFAGVAVRDVGLSGLKDRDAVTTQWFSLPAPKQGDPSWDAFAEAGIEVLAVTHHGRKLRRGVHRRNRFRLVLREFAGDASDLEARVARVAAAGVPNYFGAQRFGRDGGNLEEARRLLAGEIRVRDRRLRGIYLSAARSHLFNRVLARRVEAEAWDRPLAGDVMNLDGRHGMFTVVEVDEEIGERSRAGEIHPTGPLWGRGGMVAGGAAAEHERAALADLGWWCDALEGFGLDMDRRALRLNVEGLTLEEGPEGSLVLGFELRSGAFATTVLRELISVA
ncbi:MAG: tRNA pseudouridine(13) synthase TruD [Gammaproteobacteria bacterium]|nr:tRNA pseudouridine(13) synthase TruD [Gammaproteobacteria bacterium]